MNASIGDDRTTVSVNDWRDAFLAQACSPEALRETGPASDADYADVFVLTGRFGAYPVEEWARALFENAAGRTGQFLWRHVLRLRLTRWGTARVERSGSPGFVDRGESNQIAGWRVVQRGEDWIRLAASGAVLSGNLVVRVRPQQVFLGTYVWFDTRVGGWLWRALAPIHRRAAPDLLRDGLANLTGRP